MAGLAWASLDNSTSFWFTKPSLLNLIGRAGFNTVYELAHPLVFDGWDRRTEARYKCRDRLVLVGARSEERPMITTPSVNEVPLREVPEDVEARQYDPPPGT